jgi:hypothetical protein
MSTLNSMTRRNIRIVSVREDRRHKFRVGQAITVMSREAEFLTSTFEIRCLLPERDRAFQYRVKNAITGRERVVAEDEITAVVS